MDDLLRSGPLVPCIALAIVALTSAATPWRGLHWFTGTCALMAGAVAAAIGLMRLVEYRDTMQSLGPLALIARQFSSVQAAEQFAREALIGGIILTVVGLAMFVRAETAAKAQKRPE